MKDALYDSSQRTRLGKPLQHQNFEFSLKKDQSQGQLIGGQMLSIWKQDTQLIQLYLCI